MEADLGGELVGDVLLDPVRGEVGGDGVVGGVAGEELELEVPSVGAGITGPGQRGGFSCLDSGDDGDGARACAVVSGVAGRQTGGEQAGQRPSDRRRARGGYCEDGDKGMELA
ncbi:hypothetical protein ACGFX2_38625 [Streptomyces goshikiensis]|uniref:hypothetical protein n=1 Tax=Streptomyces goshikiensis TaxID=1942 RepID=UPI00371183D9